MSTRLPLYRNPLHQLIAGSTWRAAWFLFAYLVWGACCGPPSSRPR